MSGLETSLRHYAIHGHNVSIHADVPAIANALHARLRFFQSAAIADAGITVSLHRVPDDASHCVVRPSGPSRPVYDPPSGVVDYFEDSRQLFLDNGQHVRVSSDVDAGAIQISVASDDTASCWTASHGLFTLPLIDLLKHHGRYSLHAACVSVNGTGILLPGNSGSGKSTLALALLRSGFDFLGDDMIFLECDGAGVRVLAFPDEIDLTPDSVRFFPDLAPLLNSPRPSGWPKYQLRTEDAFGIKPVSECRPNVLVFPRISGSEQSVLNTIERNEALMELAPNILLTDPAASQAHFDALAALVEQCTCYRLETGSDLQSVATLLRRLIP